MAYIDYPLNENYRERWEFANSRGLYLDYVKWAMQAGYSPDADACSTLGGYWGPIHVVNQNGQDYVKGSSVVWVCQQIIEMEPPDTAMILKSGEIRVIKETSLGWKGLVTQFVQGIMKTAGVFAMIGTVAGLEPMKNSFAGLSNKLGVPLGKIGDKMGEVFDSVQKITGWMSDYAHVDFLERANRIGRALVPEYDQYWIEQENSLAHASKRIFGDAAHVTGYVRILEMMYFDLALSSEGDVDKARHESLKHGANLTEKIRKGISKYERNPGSLWGDLYRETFGESNPYASKDQVRFGAGFIQKLDQVATKVDRVNEAAERLGVYSVELEKVNLKTLADGTGAIADWTGDNLEQPLKDVIRTVHTEAKDQGKQIAKLDQEREAEREKRERSYLMTADPNHLSPAERTVQGENFIKSFDNAIPGLTSPEQFKPYDVEGFFNGSK